MSTVTVKELEDLIQSIDEKETKISEIEAEQKVRKAETAKLLLTAYNYLVELNLEKFPSKFGTLEVDDKSSVKVPKTVEDKALLWEWMREKGIFDAYATVNSRSLQSLFKAERDVAKRNGEDMVVWTIPGIEPPTTFKTAKLKTSKKLKELSNDEDT